MENGGGWRESKLRGSKINKNPEGHSGSNNVEKERKKSLKVKGIIMTKMIGPAIKQVLRLE